MSVIFPRKGSGREVLDDLNLFIFYLVNLRNLINPVLVFFFFFHFFILLFIFLNF